jgi:nucleoside-diphosphate-sugar epimerase
LTSNHVTCQTNGRERRRFIYKSDCVEALIALADSSQQTAEIAGAEWVTIGQVAEEIARQTNAEIALGQRDGSEIMIDPELLLPNWQPKVNLSEGIAKVIRDARAYLAAESGRAMTAQQQAVAPQK